MLLIRSCIFIGSLIKLEKVIAYFRLMLEWVKISIKKSHWLSLILVVMREGVEALGEVEAENN